jgi:hypothetical protein
MRKVLEVLNLELCHAASIEDKWFFKKTHGKWYFRMLESRWLEIPNDEIPALLDKKYARFSLRAIPKRETGEVKTWLEKIFCLDMNHAARY